MFWFLVACACLAGTAWYLYGVAALSRGSMLYVPVEKTHVYLDRSLKPQELNELVDFHTRLTLESFLNRGPKGPLNPERITLLFTGKGLEQALADRRETAYDFKVRNIHQLMEVGRVNVQHFSDGTAFTIVEGQIVRISTDPTTKESIIQSFQVSAELNWARNPSMRDARRFPFVCTEISYKLNATSSTEDIR